MKPIDENVVAMVKQDKARGMTQREIAARVGCTPTMVGRVVKDLERGGYLHWQPEGLVVTKELPARW